MLCNHFMQINTFKGSQHAIIQPCHQRAIMSSSSKKHTKTSCSYFMFFVHFQLVAYITTNKKGFSDKNSEETLLLSRGIHTHMKKGFHQC